ncbi:unnamed protein product [Effrenium voratum]|nr:unnamed protein product [Effrenium voratum]
MQRLVDEPDLEELDLEGQLLGKKGAQRLARGLLSHQSLRELNLARASIGDEGAAYIAGALQRNRSLESLNLRNNGIGDTGCEGLAEALNDVDGSLTELNLSHNSFGDVGLSALKVLAQSSLRELDLSGQKSVSSEAWSSFAGRLGQTRLRGLKLRQNPALADGFCEALPADLGSLQELDVSLCSVSVISVGRLFSLSHVQLLGNSLTDQVMEVLSDALANDSPLESLDFSRCGLTGACCGSLARALQRAADELSNLQTLHLDRNDLGFQGAIALAPGLQLGALRQLTLRECKLGDGGVGALAEALESNRTLKELDLAGNEVSDLGAESLALALEKGPRLMTLGLKTNLIGDAGAGALAKAFSKNSALEELDLGKNCITMPGISQLCAALEKNGSLRSLVLDGNEADQEVMDTVETLAADVMSRRERLPKPVPPAPPHSSDSEDGSSPSASSDEASKRKATREVRKEKVESGDKTMSMVDDFVQRFEEREKVAATRLCSGRRGADWGRRGEAEG